MNFNILNFSLCLTEETIAFLFFNFLLNKRFIGKKHVILLITAIVLNAILMFTLININIISRNIIVVIAIFLTLQLLYSDKLYIKFTLTVLTTYLLLIMDIIVGSLLSVALDKNTAEMFFSSFEFRLVSSYIVKSINAAVFVLAYRLLKKISFDTGRKEWIMLGLCAVIYWSISMNFMSVYPSGDFGLGVRIALLGAACGFFVTSLVIISFFSQISSFFQKEKKLYLLESNYSALEKQLELQNQINKKINKMRHDMKGHIYNAVGLFKSKNSEIANKLLSELDRELDSFNINLAESSGNSVIDVIVSYKQSLCESKNIKFSYKMERVGEVNIKPAELSSILSNMLDNAIEATEKTENPFIQLWVLEQKTFLTFIVKNSYHSPPYIKDNRLITKKKDKNYHGLGTEIIIEIAEKNQGSFNFTYDGKIFSATAMLKIIKKD